MWKIERNENFTTKGKPNNHCLFTKKLIYKFNIQNSGRVKFYVKKAQKINCNTKFVKLAWFYLFFLGFYIFRLGFRNCNCKILATFSFTYIKIGRL